MSDLKLKKLVKYQVIQRCCLYAFLTLMTLPRDSFISFESGFITFGSRCKFGSTSVLGPRLTTHLFRLSLTLFIHLVTPSLPLSFIESTHDLTSSLSLSSPLLSPELWLGLVPPLPVSPRASPLHDWCLALHGQRRPGFTTRQFERRGKKEGKKRKEKTIAENNKNGLKWI